MAFHARCYTAKGLGGLGAIAGVSGMTHVPSDQRHSPREDAFPGLLLNSPQSVQQSGTVGVHSCGKFERESILG